MKKLLIVSALLLCTTNANANTYQAAAGASLDATFDVSANQKQITNQKQVANQSQGFTSSILNEGSKAKSKSAADANNQFSSVIDNTDNSKWSLVQDFSNKQKTRPTAGITIAIPAAQANPNDVSFGTWSSSVTLEDALMETYNPDFTDVFEVGNTIVVITANRAFMDRHKGAGSNQWAPMLLKDFNKLKPAVSGNIDIMPQYGKGKIVPGHVLRASILQALGAKWHGIKVYFTPTWCETNVGVDGSDSGLQIGDGIGNFFGQLTHAASAAIGKTKSRNEKYPYYTVSVRLGE